MKVQNNITIFSGADPSQTKKAEAKDGQNGQKNKTFFVGNLNGNETLRDRISMRKKEAQEKAMKVVSDAWAGDRSIDQDMQTRRDHIAQLREENKEALAQIKDISQEQADLQARYGVEEDSKEQSDLELIRAKRNWENGRGGSPTMEQMAYIEKLEAEGLTDYQQQQLGLDDLKYSNQKVLDENNQQIVEESAIIRGTKLERLKSAPMVKAQKEAEEIEKAASEEIIGMVVEESKEHIEEEMEKKKEQAEKLEEKKEEQEELIEKQKEKREEQEELLDNMPTDEILSLDQNKSDVQKEVQNIVDKMKLVAEDIKGALVDESR